MGQLKQENAQKAHACDKHKQILHRLLQLVTLSHIFNSYRADLSNTPAPCFTGDTKSYSRPAPSMIFTSSSASHSHNAPHSTKHARKKKPKAHHEWRSPITRHGRVAASATTGRDIERKDDERSELATSCAMARMRNERAPFALSSLPLSLSQKH